MRRIPIVATIVVAGAVAVMIGLGIWQLQRAAWKDRLLTELAAARDLPALDLDPILANGNPAGAPIAFRRVLITCDNRGAVPSLRAARNRNGETGYGYFIPCRPGATGLAGRIEVNAGWSRGPDQTLRPALTGIVAGMTGTAEPDSPIIVTAATASAPLAAASPPSIEDIPNNHMAYAFQWFFFAGVAVLIYALVLLRRPKVAPPPTEP